MTPRTELSQWFTPYSLALQMGHLLVGLLDRPDYNWRLLDPGCGDGRLGRAVCEASARSGRPVPREIIGYEIDLDLQANTNWLYDRVVNDDFLDASSGDHFDACVMNPPYEDGLDGRFVEQALEVSDLVVTLVKADVLFGGQRYNDFWSSAASALQIQVNLANRPWFGGSHTASSNYVVLVLSNVYEYRDFEPFQWWYDTSWSDKKTAQVAPSWLRA